MENLEKPVLLAIECINVADKIKNESAPGVGPKLAHLMLLSDEVFSLAAVDWKKLDDEWKNGGAEGKAALVAKVKEKLDLKDDKAEELVEFGMDLLVTLSDKLEKGIGLLKSAKAA